MCDEELTKIYIICDENNDLLAFTTSKEILKMYKIQRESKKIRIYKEYKDRYDMRKFVGSHTAKNLSKYDIITTINHIDPIKITVAVTNEEISLIESQDYIYNNILQKLLPITVFKKKYKKALKLLQYHNIYRLTKSDIVSDFDSGSLKMDQLVALNMLDDTNMKI